MLFSHVVSCSAASGRISYPCIARRCGDGTTSDLTQDVVSSVTLSLVPDDSEIDGHRECRILLRPLQGSMCIFNITTGSTLLRVMDDEGECCVTFIANFAYCAILHKTHLHLYSHSNFCQFLVNVHKLHLFDANMVKNCYIVSTNVAEVWSLVY